MRCAFGLFLFLVISQAKAEHAFSAPGWAVEARLASKADKDTFFTPSPQGSIWAIRDFLERSGERTCLVRSSYPVAMLPGEETGVYAKAASDMLKSRPGEVKLREKFTLGLYDGERIVIAQRRERTVR